MLTYARQMATQTQANTAKVLSKLLDEYKQSLKAKGPVLEWSDAFLEKFQTKYRNAARKYRGSWSIEFYEALQDINKESLKRSN